VTFAENKRRPGPSTAAAVIQANRAAAIAADRKGKGRAIVPYYTSIAPAPKPRPSTSGVNRGQRGAASTSNAGTSNARTSRQRSTASGAKKITTMSSAARGRPGAYSNRRTLRKSTASETRRKGRSNQAASRSAPSGRPSASQAAKNNGVSNPRALKNWTVWNRATKPAVTPSGSRKKKANTRNVHYKKGKRRRK